MTRRDKVRTTLTLATLAVLPILTLAARNIAADYYYHNQDYFCSHNDQAGTACTYANKPCAAGQSIYCGNAYPQGFCTMVDDPYSKCAQNQIVECGHQFDCATGNAIKVNGELVHCDGSPITCDLPT